MYLRTAVERRMRNLLAGSRPYSRTLGRRQRPLSDALAKAAHQLGDKVAELQQQLTEKQTALADLRRNIKDYPRGLLPFRAKLAEELEQQAGNAGCGRYSRGRAGN